jgi:hypothetical protein
MLDLTIAKHPVGAGFELSVITLTEACAAVGLERKEANSPLFTHSADRERPNSPAFDFDSNIKQESTHTWKPSSQRTPDESGIVIDRNNQSQKKMRVSFGQGSGRSTQRK